MPTLNKLDPRFRPAAQTLLRVARQLDARFTVTSARRSRADQVRLYTRWVRGESPFPALPPGRSQHERGLAVDLARLGVAPQDDQLLAELGAAWRGAGGVWGGSVDPVHFEAPRSVTGR
jgi:LAS superfamily LD-carboxypeptidase LdcB